MAAGNHDLAHFAVDGGRFATQLPPMVGEAADDRAPSNAASALSDDELLLRIARADRDAFRLLYERYARRFYGLGLRMFRDQDQAEDGLQEVFARIWTRAAQFDPARGPALFWLSRLCRNLYLDRLRARRRVEQWQAPEQDSMPEPGTPFDAPGLALSLEETARLVRAALEKLPEELRLLTTLSFFDGLSHSEIAAQMRMPLGTVKTRLRRAMDQLRADLKDQIQLSDS